jgi:hypothetical protein
MPNRSIRDIIQGTAHSLGLAKEDPPDAQYDPNAAPATPTPAAAPAAAPVAAPAAAPTATQTITNRGTALNKAIDDAS